MTRSRTSPGGQRIRQITIVGTGLIGGSLGLALRKNGFSGKIIGCAGNAGGRDHRIDCAAGAASLFEHSPDRRWKYEGGNCCKCTKGLRQECRATFSRWPSYGGKGKSGDQVCRAGSFSWS